MQKKYVLLLYLYHGSSEMCTSWCLLHICAMKKGYKYRCALILKIQLLVSSQKTVEPMAFRCSMLSGTVNLTLVLPCHPCPHSLPPHSAKSLVPLCNTGLQGCIGPAVFLISVCHLVIRRVTASFNGPESMSPIIVTSHDELLVFPLTIPMEGHSVCAFFFSSPA